MHGLSYAKDADGIVTITMDMEGPVNSMNEHFSLAFESIVEKLEAEKDLTGIILASAKKTFFAGGNLHMLLSIQPERQAEFHAGVEHSKAVMRRYELLPVPKVAAINGAALGGGFELCLLHNRRIAWNDRSVKVGLPEVTLGLLPGAGGVVRMTHLLGVQDAMPYLIEGKQVSPEDAKAAGLIHDTVATLEDLLPAARAWILESQGKLQATIQPWDDPTRKIPGGTANSPKLAPMIAVGAAMMADKTKGRLPAPVKIFDTMLEATRVKFDVALKIEGRNFAYLVTTPQAKNMITAFFFNLNKVNGGGSRPKDVPPSKVKKLGVIGAGMMGQGIAYVSAMAGIEVVLKDVELAGAERGKTYSEMLLTKRVSRGKMAEEKKQAVLDLIKPTAHSGDLEGCDLVIEAVFERIDLKNQVVKEHESLLAEGGIWASNTSTLPITRLAEASQRPDHFIGLHFFSPVDKMPLLEIVVGKDTSDETLARSFDYARQIKKTPIVVEDAVGFYTSRTIGTHIMEGAQLVHEGVDPVRIEALARGLMYPVGPLTMLDEVSLSLSKDIYNTQVAMGLVKKEDNPTPAATALIASLVDEHDRPGKKIGRGFYDYGQGGKTMWPGLANWKKDVDISDQDIEDRLLFRPVIESLKCLEQGVLRNVPDANIGSIMGIGAPPWTGGYLQYVNTYGLDHFVARCAELTEKYGPRFEAPEIVKKYARENKLFV